MKDQPKGITEGCLDPRGHGEMEEPYRRDQLVCFFRGSKAAESYLKNRVASIHEMRPQINDLRYSKTHVNMWETGQLIMMSKLGFSIATGSWPRNVNTSPAKRKGKAIAIACTTTAQRAQGSRLIRSHYTCFQCSINLGGATNQTSSSGRSDRTCSERWYIHRGFLFANSFS